MLNKFVTTTENIVRIIYHLWQALLEYIGDREDLYLAEQRLTDLRACRTSAIPLEDLMKTYRLTDPWH